MIDETSVDVLAFACVAFEFPDWAGGGQLLFGAFAAQIAFDDEGLLAKVREVFPPSLPLSNRIKQLPFSPKALSFSTHSPINSGVPSWQCCLPGRSSWSSM